MKALPHSFPISSSMGAFGVIARDSGGSVHVWHVGRVSASSASIIACSTAMEMDYSEVIFESDCLVLMNCFKDTVSPCPREISRIALGSFQEMVFCLV